MLATQQGKSMMMSVLLVLVGLAGARAAGQVDPLDAGSTQGFGVAGRQWLAQDLHLTAGTLLRHQVAPGQHLLLCRDGFSMMVAGRQYTSRRALVWIASGEAEAQGDAGKGYQIQVYLADRISHRQAGDGAGTEPTEIVLDRDKAMVVKARVAGEVFVTADKSDTGNPRRRPLYEETIAAFEKAGVDLPPAPKPLAEPGPARTGAGEPNKPSVGYTINFAPLTDVPLKLERTVSEDGQEIITLIGRVYIWWEQPTDQKKGPSELLELEADSFVVWQRASDAKPTGTDLSASKLQGVTDVYAAGSVVLRQGQRTIYADNLYYDLGRDRALANNVVLKTFDPQRDVPIYIRAKELRQLGANEYEGQDVVVSTSEFYQPQISLEAAQIHFTEKLAEAGAQEAAGEGGYEVELNQVRLKYGNMTLLGLSKVHSTSEGLGLPIRSVRTGYDNTFGASLETRWYLSRLLGLREPAGTNSTLDVDYYSKRGPGAGIEVNYAREDYFGSFLGYMIYDHGEDRLSRTQQNVNVPDDFRGRLRLLHRQYLPYGWQLTAEASYLSDENFLEQYYRTEYNVGKEQETLLYLKRIQDNWGLAFLGKVRVNDFLNQVEELPSAEFHLTGQSLFDDRFTFFSDSQVSQYRYRYASGTSGEPEGFFLFTATRNELDMPLSVGRSKIVPYVAGTFGYDDGAGFHAGLDEEPVRPEEAIWIGEAGVRASTQSYWAVYPDVRSQFWDLNQLRHVITPTLTAAKYVASDPAAVQRDVLDLEIGQRWQTKRGPADRLRTVDWLELNTNFVWVSESNTESAGPDRLIWSAPYIPLVDRAARVLPPIDRRSTDQFGPRQNYVSVDGILRLTDTTSVLGDSYIGMQTGTLDQADIGFSRMIWPDLTYYVGLNYLRRFYVNDEEKSSNAVTFAVTYVLDPRYTLVFSNQYDYGYGANIATELTLVRKYHRMNLALTFGIDGTLDEKRVILGLWPEGIPELAFGLHRYMGLGASRMYY